MVLFRASTARRRGRTGLFGTYDFARRPQRGLGPESPTVYYRNTTTREALPNGNPETAARGDV